ASACESTSRRTRFEGLHALRRLHRQRRQPLGLVAREPADRRSGRVECPHRGAPFSVDPQHRSHRRAPARSAPPRLIGPALSRHPRKFRWARRPRQILPRPALQTRSLMPVSSRIPATRALATAVALAPGAWADSAAASCGSAACVVNTQWQIHGIPTEAGGTLFQLQYDYIRQDTLLAGSHKTNVAPENADALEQKTISQTLTASLDYTFDR